MKVKYLRVNQGKFMTKGLHKAITKRSRLQNNFYVIGRKRPKMNTKSK